MVTAVEELNELLRSAEAVKSDTIAESLAGMISRLEASLTQSLSNIPNGTAHACVGPDERPVFCRG